MSKNTGVTLPVEVYEEVEDQELLENFLVGDDTHFEVHQQVRDFNGVVVLDMNRFLNTSGASYSGIWKGRPLYTEEDCRRMTEPPLPPEPGYE